MKCINVQCGRECLSDSAFCGPCLMTEDPCMVVCHNSEAQHRKETPIFSGFVKYFPLAMAKVSQLSFIANEQHNPGEPMHWAKDKSTDHEDCLMRHLADHAAGTITDTDGQLHLTKVAWRAMAALEIFLEKEDEAKESADRTS